MEIERDVKRCIGLEIENETSFSTARNLTKLCPLTNHLMWPESQSVANQISISFDVTRKPTNHLRWPES